MALKAELDAAEQEVAAWISSGPERNDDNMKKYKEMNANIEELSGKLSEY